MSIDYYERIIKSRIYGWLGLSPQEIQRLKMYARDDYYNFYIYGKRVIEDTIRKAQELSKMVDKLQAQVLDAQARVSQIQKEFANLQYKIQDALNKVKEIKDKMIPDLENRINSTINTLNALIEDYKKKLGQLREDAATILQNFFNEFQKKVQEFQRLSYNTFRQLQDVNRSLNTKIGQLQGSLNRLVEYVDGDEYPKTGRYPDDILYSAKQVMNNINGLNLLNIPDAIKRLWNATKWSAVSLYNLQYPIGEINTTFSLLKGLVDDLTKLTNLLTSYFVDSYNILFGIKITPPKITTPRITPPKPRGIEPGEPTISYLERRATTKYPGRRPGGIRPI